MKNTDPIGYYLLTPKVLLSIFIFSLLLFTSLTKITLDLVEEVKQDTQKLNLEKQRLNEKHIESQVTELVKEIEISLLSLMSFIEAFGRIDNINQFTQKLIEHHQLINNLIIFNKYGDTQFYPENLTPLNASDRDYFKFHKSNPLKGIYISDFFIGRMKNELIFTVSLPLLNETKQFEGIFLAAVKPTAFKDIYENLAREGFGLRIYSPANTKLFYGDALPEKNEDIFIKEIKINKFPLVFAFFEKNTSNSLFTYTNALLSKVKNHLILWGLFSFIVGSIAIYSLRKQFILSTKYLKASTRDYLTKIYNRREFMRLLAIEYKRSLRHDHELSVLMIDLDHFKQVNDRHGHQLGDKVLTFTAEVLMSLIRKTDVLARIGGEEFAIFLPETDLQNACLAAEKFRRTLDDHLYIDDNVALQITASFGVASAKNLDIEDIELANLALLELADIQLYKAKEKRNAVMPSF